MQKILVVDHDIHTARMLSASLEAEGYSVISSDSLDKAIPKIEEELPSLVLLDLMSFDKAGMDVAKEISSRYDDLDIIFLTGHHNDDMALEVMSVGASDYLQKPFRRDELLKIIRQTLFVRSEIDKDILKTKILIVDDDRLCLELAKDALEGAGEITTANSPLLALRKMKGKQFDILLTDIYMPEMDGMDLVRRARLINPNIKVILLTGISDMELARAALKEGVSDYITKPAEAEKIRESVISLIDRRKRETINTFRRRIERKEKQEAEQFEATLNMIEALITALEARDPYTRGHSERVTGYSVSIGKCMGLKRDEIEKVRHSARLHDIGKIGTVDDFLYKTGKLSAGEMSEMAKHPIVGSNIMKPVTYMAEFIPGVRHHHERYDGNGYPDRLRGDDIPLAARIIAVADSYDAMTSTRPYRAGMAKEIAIMELENNKGVQFDPAVVDTFLRDVINGGQD